MQILKKENRDLCKKVFRMNDILAEEGTERFRHALTPEESKLLYYYMTSGAYGTTERRVVNSMSQHRKKDGSISKAAYIIKTTVSGERAV